MCTSGALFPLCLLALAQCRMSEGRTRKDVDAIFRVKGACISHAVVCSVQHLTLAKAAAKLGVSCTTLKKKCRTLGLMRWGPRRRQILAHMRSLPPPRVESDAIACTGDGDYERELLLQLQGDTSDNVSELLAEDAPAWHGEHMAQAELLAEDAPAWHAEHLAEDWPAWHAEPLAEEPSALF